MQETPNTPVQRKNFKKTFRFASIGIFKGHCCARRTYTRQVRYVMRNKTTFFICFFNKEAGDLELSKEYNIIGNIYSYNCGDIMCLINCMVLERHNFNNIIDAIALNIPPDLVQNFYLKRASQKEP